MRRHKVIRASGHALSAGADVILPIEAKGEAARALDRDGRVKVRVRFTYRPAGGQPRTKFEGSQADLGPRTSP